MRIRITKEHVENLKDRELLLLFEEKIGCINVNMEAREDSEYEDYLVVLGKDGNEYGFHISECNIIED